MGIGWDRIRSTTRISRQDKTRQDKTRQDKTSTLVSLFLLSISLSRSISIHNYLTPKPQKSPSPLGSIDGGEGPGRLGWVGFDRVYLPN